MVCNRFDAKCVRSVYNPNKELGENIIMQQTVYYLQVIFVQKIIDKWKKLRMKNGLQFGLGINNQTKKSND